MFVTPYQLALIAGGFTILGALLGNWLSHYFSGNRDRRKEFNDAADILDAILRKERKYPSPSTIIDFSAFRRVLKDQKLSSFDICVEEYKTTIINAQIEHYPFEGEGFLVAGSGRFQDKAPIVAALDKLLEFTKRK